MVPSRSSVTATVQASVSVVVIRWRSSVAGMRCEWGAVSAVAVAAGVAFEPRARLPQGRAGTHGEPEAGGAAGATVYLGVIAGGAVVPGGGLGSAAVPAAGEWGGVPGGAVSGGGRQGGVFTVIGGGGGHLPRRPGGVTGIGAPRGPRGAARA